MLGGYKVEGLLCAFFGQTARSDSRKAGGCKLQTFMRLIREMNVCTKKTQVDVHFVITCVSWSGMQYAVLTALKIRYLREAYSKICYVSLATQTVACYSQRVPVMNHTHD